MSMVAVGIGTAVAGAGATAYGASKQAGAAKDAAAMQAKSAREANQLQRDMFNQQRADQEPWRQAGAAALGQMGNADLHRDFTQADFRNDPGYAFRMQGGQQAIERSAAARGGLNSGATLKALSRYGQDFASNEYGNAYNRFNADRDRRFNRLSSLAGVGQTANSQVAAAGQNYANNVGANSMGAASAAGNARMAGAQAWGQAASGIAQQGMDWMAQWNKTQGTK